MKKFLRILFYLFLLLLVVVGTFLGWRYVQYANDPDPGKTFLIPRVKAVRVEITSLTSTNSDMVAHLRIKNHLPFSIKVDSIHYKIFVDGTEVLHNNYGQSLRLKGSDSTAIKIPMTLLIQDFKAIVKKNELAGIDSVDYEMQVSFYTNILISKKTALVFTETLPLYHFPELKLENVEVDSLNLKRAALRFHVGMYNGNAFTIKPKNISYRLVIEDHEPIEGTIPAKDLKAQSTTYFEMPISIPFREARKTLFDLLEKNNEGTYSLQLTFTLDSESDLLSNSRVTLEGSGKIRSMLKSKKEERKKKRKKRRENQ